MKLPKPLAITLLLSSPLGFAIDSQDFVKDNVFTQGIEGPTMYNGALYAVNYAQQGTIGRVDNMGKTSLFVRLPNDSVGNGCKIE